MANLLTFKLPCLWDQIFSILDRLNASLIQFPTALMYFRGSWDLIGYYMPANAPVTYWSQTLIGTCTVFNWLILPVLDKQLNPIREERKVLRV